MTWWQQLYQYGRQIFALAQKVERHDGEMKQMRQDLDRLTKTVEQIIYEIRRDRDASEKDREILLLRLENQLLRFERRLPPPPSNSVTEQEL